MAGNINKNDSIYTFDFYEFDVNGGGKWNILYFYRYEVRLYFFFEVHVSMKWVFRKLEIYLKRFIIEKQPGNS